MFLQMVDYKKEGKMISPLLQHRFGHNNNSSNNNNNNNNNNNKMLHSENWIFTTHAKGNITFLAGWQSTFNC